MPDDLLVRTLLRRVGRRLWAWRALRRLLRSCAGASAAASVVLLASRFVLAQDLRGAGLLCLAVLGVGVAMIPGLRRVSAVQAARMVDATFGLGERFVTAVECIGQPGGMPGLLVQDAARCSFRLDVRRVPRVPVGLDALLAAVGIAAASFVWLQLADPSVLSLATGVRPGGKAAIPIAGAGAVRPTSAARQSPGDGVQQEARGGLRQVLGLESEEFVRRSPQTASSGTHERPQEAGSPSGSGVGPGVGRESAGITGREGSARETDPTTDRLARSFTTAQEPPSLSGPRPDSSGRISASQGSEATAGLPLREGQAAGPENGTPGLGTDTPGRAGTTIGGGAGTRVAARDAAPTTRSERPDRPARDRRLAPPGISAAAADTVFARAPVPPTLRRYILRYFQELQSPANGEDPS